jgi:glycosyltransferase involved in cell wall biosynthesis
MTKPKISVMMCSYNTVQWIKQSIISIQNQTYANWELIIQDDASDDGTYELAEALAQKDPRITVFQNAQRLNTAKNRAEAVKHCTGDLICHCDSDDYIEQWAFEVFVKEFEKHPDIGLFYSDFAQVSVTNAIESYSASKDFDPNKLHQHGWRHLGMYRRSLLSKISGYNTRLDGCEDGDLFMQIAEITKLKRIPKVLYFYRNWSNNSTRTLKKCADCSHRMECNYMRVWAKSANYNQETFKPLSTESK